MNNPLWRTYREPDGWWVRFYAKNRCEWMDGPFKSSRKAEVAVKAHIASIILP